VAKISLSQLDVSPCLGCHRCLDTGECILQDDYQVVRDRLIRADIVAFASPAYFWNVPSQAKAFIDRHQSLWAWQALAGPAASKASSQQARRGVLLAVAADPVPQFDGLIQTVDALFRAYGIPLSDKHLITDAFVKDALRDRQAIREAALESGRAAVTNLS